MVPSPPGYDPPPPAPLTSHAAAAAEIVRQRQANRRLALALRNLVEACTAPAGYVGAARLNVAIAQARVVLEREQL